MVWSEKEIPDGNRSICWSKREGEDWFSKGKISDCWARSVYPHLTLASNPDTFYVCWTQGQGGYYQVKFKMVDATEVGVEDEPGESTLPKAFVLSQNYPNPFNPTTQIKYSLPKDCWVKLGIYNILGQRVATLVDGEQKAGYKTVRWDASSLSSGIYFYRIEAGDFTETKKMILLK